MCAKASTWPFKIQVIMNKNQKIIFFTGLGVVVALIILVVVLLVRSLSPEEETPVEAEQTDAQERVDSLQNAYDQLELTQEFTQLESDFSQYEEQQKYLKNDTLVRQYNAARDRIQSLLKELKQEKNSNQENRAKIESLKAEIATLKDIVRHYLEEINRLGQENSALKQEIEEVKANNANLNSQVAATTRSNEELENTVRIARKLNITGLSLSALNKKGKHEKNVTKARQLCVSFTVAPNNTASPGHKTFYVRIQNPEGAVLGGGTSCNYQGTSVACTAAHSYEYANTELHCTLYWDVNTTLTPGSYRVDVFCDGNRLSSASFTLSK